MLSNEFKKYNGVNAVRLRSEQDFLDKLVQHCADDKPFLFGCDSCNIVTKFYNHCLSINYDKADKFILITADTQFRVKDASEDFAGKYVFFSPKITFGVDFSVPDAQDMFIYINGQSIQPSGCFQQSTRCRNIENLYYYGECNQDMSRYESLEQVKNEIKQCTLTSKTFLTTCTYLDEEDRLQVVENTFFNLFCYNEYVKDLYDSNKLKHFELILEENGFNMTTQGEKHKASLDIDMDVIQLELYEEFMNTTNPHEPKYKPLLSHINYLGISHDDKHNLDKFKDIIMDKHKVKDHDNIIRMLKSEDYINAKLTQLHMSGIDVKLLNNTFQKIKLLKLLDTTYNIDFLNEQGSNSGVMADDLYQLIKHTFRLRQIKPTTTEAINDLYSAMVRSITNDKTLVRSGKKGFSTNITTFKHHLALNNIKNKSQLGFSQSTIDTFGIEVASIPQAYLLMILTSKNGLIQTR